MQSVEVAVCPELRLVANVHSDKGYMDLHRVARDGNFSQIVGTIPVFSHDGHIIAFAGTQLVHGTHGGKRLRSLKVHDLEEDAGGAVRVASSVDIFADKLTLHGQEITALAARRDVIVYLSHPGHVHVLMRSGKVWNEKSVHAWPGLPCAPRLAFSAREDMTVLMRDRAPRRGLVVDLGPGQLPLRVMACRTFNRDYADCTACFYCQVTGLKHSVVEGGHWNPIETGLARYPGLGVFTKQTRKRHGPFLHLVQSKTQKAMATMSDICLAWVGACVM
jgi:hypothetical protein